MASIAGYLNVEGYKKFEKAMHLSTDSAKNDPLNEPYKSYYEAREFFFCIRKNISQFYDIGQDITVKVALASIDLHLGCNFCDTDETNTGEEYLNKALESTENYNTSERAISIYVHALNHLGILWSTRGQYDKAGQYFDKAERLFYDYKTTVGNVPHRIDEIFINPEVDERTRQRSFKFENILTHTFYYKAQVLAKLGKDVASAEYCHSTLKRQLDSHDFDQIEWALNAATLSQVYLTQGKFPLARHCLACASIMMQTRIEAANSDECKKECMSKDADICRCWVKYALQILETSQDQMLPDDSHNCSVQTDIDNYNKYTSEQNTHKNDEQDMDAKLFQPFNMETTIYEECITCDLVNSFDNARSVFLFVQEKINHSMKMYTLNSHCSDYIEIIQDYSKAFKLLAFFEHNKERQCCMHKRRINMLFDLLNVLNVQYYLLACRQLRYEVAEAYSTVLNIKLSITEAGESNRPAHACRKINLLARQSINQYQAYLDMLKGNKPHLPDTIPDGNVRPALIAMFCCGQLWGKIITDDKQERLLYMKQSLDAYRFVVDYCRRHPEAKADVEKEFSVFEELTELLPLKMQKIKNAIPGF